MVRCFELALLGGERLEVSLVEAVQRGHLHEVGAQAAAWTARTAGTAAALVAVVVQAEGQQDNLRQVVGLEVRQGQALPGVRRPGPP